MTSKDGGVASVPRACASSITIKPTSSVPDLVHRAATWRGADRGSSSDQHDTGDPRRSGAVAAQGGELGPNPLQFGAVLVDGREAAPEHRDKFEFAILEDTKRVDGGGVAISSVDGHDHAPYPLVRAGPTWSA
jgi:hypothetical protein